jgi:uncharacterized delta-60 repeat protein
VLSNGKIVVGGYSESRTNPSGSQNYEIARFNADGTPDTTFGSGGRVTIDIRGTADTPGVIVLGAAGTLAVAGSSVDPLNANQGNMSMAEVADDGGLATSFGAGGEVVYASGADDGAQSVALDALGRFVLAGGVANATPSDFALWRVTASGTFDSSWGDGGLVTTDFSGRDEGASTVLVQPDGKVVAVGTSLVGASADSLSIALARYLPAHGDLDPTFGVGGKTLTLPAVANTSLGSQAAAFNGCNIIVVGLWDYDLNMALSNYTIGIARYRR